MGRGRPKEPVDLILAKGNKPRLTKKEIADRKEQEIEIKSDDIIVPEWLTNQKDINKFKYLANLIYELGIWSELDNDCLGRYIMTENDYLKYSKELRDAMKKKPIDFKELKTIQQQQDTAFKQCTKCASELGMTVSSRAKMVVPRVATDDDEL